jgi:radical SAM protein with 4Fe4S-binding SPASM domain
MPFDEYAGWLDRLAEEGIDALRLTGGEPLTVPGLADYLALAGEKNFHVTLNTNAVIRDVSSWDELLPFVDCLKISFPAPDEKSMAGCTQVKGAWEKKLEAAALAAAKGVRVEFLTPMFPAAIASFDVFVELLTNLSFIRWLPLRAEASPGDARPVSWRDMLRLIDKITRLRSGEHDRWDELRLHLATPFCLLDSPQTAATLLHGRQGCGPLRSVTISPQGGLMRCYSRRQALDGKNGLRSAALEAARRDFQGLPSLCRNCPVVYGCLGGCRCASVLTKGGFDYLARPRQAALWQKSAESRGGA